MLVSYGYGGGVVTSGLDKVRTQMVEVQHEVLMFDVGCFMFYVICLMIYVLCYMFNI